MLTGIDPGLTGIVLIPRGIDATPGQGGPAPSRVDLARSRELPIATGADATLHRHRRLSESGRPDQMRSRPDSDRDRCPKSSGRCRSDQGTTRFAPSRCLRMSEPTRKMLGRSQSEGLRCHAARSGSLTKRCPTQVLRGPGAFSGVRIPIVSETRGISGRGPISPVRGPVAEANHSRSPAIYCPINVSSAPPSSP